MPASSSAATRQTSSRRLPLSLSTPASPTADRVPPCRRWREPNGIATTSAPVPGARPREQRHLVHRDRRRRVVEKRSWPPVADGDVDASGVGAARRRTTAALSPALQGADGRRQFLPIERVRERCARPGGDRRVGCPKSRWHVVNIDAGPDHRPGAATSAWFRKALRPASRALGIARARERSSPDRRALREDSARPSWSRTVGTTRISRSRFRSRTRRRITATCWASFCPKNAMCGATMLKSFVQMVATPRKCPGRCAPSRSWAGPSPGPTLRAPVTLGGGGEADVTPADTPSARLRFGADGEIRRIANWLGVDERLRPPRRRFGARPRTATTCPVQRAHGRRRSSCDGGAARARRGRR